MKNRKPIPPQTRRITCPTHRIYTNGLLWFLDERKHFWVFSWWKNIYVDAFREQCENELIRLQKETR